MTIEQFMQKYRDLCIETQQLQSYRDFLDKCQDDKQIKVSRVSSNMDNLTIGSSDIVKALKTQVKLLEKSVSILEKELEKCIK